MRPVHVHKDSPAYRIRSLRANQPVRYTFPYFHFFLDCTEQEHLTKMPLIEGSDKGYTPEPYSTAWDTQKMSQGQDYSYNPYSTLSDPSQKPTSYQVDSISQDLSQTFGETLTISKGETEEEREWGTKGGSSFKCYTCGKSYPSKYDLESHMERYRHWWLR